VSILFVLLVHGRINAKAVFILCVHISEFTAKLNDGCSVDVPQKYDEWTMDCQCYTLDMLEKDLAARINWGSGQQPVVSEFDMSGVGERKLLNDTNLSLAFAEKKNERKMFLLVSVVDKPKEIDWGSLEITPLTANQIGVPMHVIDEDTMYEFLGLRAEDERAEQARAATAEKGKQIDDEPADELLVDDHVPSEDSVLYDRENPPMEEGTIYASMPEFRAAVRHHAIMNQFELGTEKSCKSVFRGYCKADGCPWSIVARLMRDNQQVKVLTLF
jgi:hypothetical protein